MFSQSVSRMLSVSESGIKSSPVLALPVADISTISVCVLI